ncbi:hypothetical protein [Litoreibacter roseus]|uniref:Apolipoprotein acyltransferase n=1 Tax=Litoreibacter roseus TaxID=2601869 RepID=A0A6N6JC75_9RHOB|nr:hypothetical protein [Litoreibacter roseus]GFE63597.1 hypothetical protein KIN_06710 [Litoreibacter roseus]
MAPVIGLVLGAATGAIIAKRKGGRGLDMAQYAAAYAIFFGLIGLFVAIFLARNAAG